MDERATMTAQSQAAADNRHILNESSGCVPCRSLRPGLRPVHRERLSLTLEVQRLERLEIDVRQLTHRIASGAGHDHFT